MVKSLLGQAHHPLRQSLEAGMNPTGLEFLHGAATGGKIILRQVDPAAAEVLRDITEDIRVLKCQPAIIRPLDRPGIDEAPDVDRRHPHGAGHPPTVAIEFGPGGIQNLGEIHAHTGEDVGNAR